LGARTSRATEIHVLRLDESGPRAPRIPRPKWTVPAYIVLSIGIHAGIFAGIVQVLEHPARTPIALTIATPDPHRAAETLHFVFIATGPTSPIGGHGGGGGGNRQPGPIRRAQGIGSDAMTLRVAKPIEMTSAPVDRPSLPSVLLDAKPLASGAFDQIGLPSGGEPSGISTGSGSGGGVGTGVGTGIGSGNGPGIGPGSGGGAGGGFYRPGGGVSSPRVVHQVKPAYTSSALLQKIQGTVVMELVVTREGRPTQVRVVRSLDPYGLDEQATLAVSQWRFEPGRLAGTPVDVLVTVEMDFWIH
jgi:periplasmic protein TonB